MAISWITALKLVPWGEVIDAAPQVIKAAKGMVRKKDAQFDEQQQQTAAAASNEHVSRLTASAGELALQKIQALEERTQQMEQSQRQSLEIIEKLAEQNAQLVTTVGALRIGAQRLAIACGVLGVICVGLVIYAFMHAR